MRPIISPVFALALGPVLAAAGGAAEPAGVPVVAGGTAVAVVVTADNPTATARYAAAELVYHLEKATGVKPAVVTEGAAPATAAARIYLGDCAAARAAGIDVKKLAPEAFALKTATGALFIAGNDGAGDPLDQNTPAGTLFGVYEWLGRDAGVRWLWPGELGTFAPKTATLTAKAVNETVAPHFFQRRVRPGLGFTAEHPALGFTPKAAEQYAKDQAVFLRRHRMGRSERMTYGHAFTDWWAKSGKDHPEWFQLLPTGKRGPAKKDARFSMCVSNPGLQQEVVNRWLAGGGGKAGRHFINAVENDILGLCDCDKCKALDGPPPPDHLTFYSPKSKVAGSRFVSDRYAKFWLGVQQRAATHDPDATVIGYVYFNYFQAPTSGVKLNEHVLLGYCPSGGWYPRSADEHEWYQKQWRGWRETGARLFSRTNYFLDGYCMPFVWAHQFADDFRHAATNGMVATDFDSLTGHWATQGPNLYLLVRLHAEPTRPADDLLAEYYAGFGPAAADVKAYFDYWETHTTANGDRTKKTFEDLTASRWRTWAKAAHAVFPPACFPPAEAMLTKAAAACAGNPEAAARVEFLRKGLEHAKLSARAAALLTLADPTSTPERGRKALEELLTFRRANERSGIDNFNHDAWVEDLSWKLSTETKQAPELYP
jgi:hypothetical protein